MFPHFCIGLNSRQLLSVLTCPLIMRFCLPCPTMSEYDHYDYHDYDYDDYDYHDYDYDDYYYEDLIIYSLLFFSFINSVLVLCEEHENALVHIVDEKLVEP